MRLSFSGLLIALTLLVSVLGFAPPATGAVGSAARLLTPYDFFSGVTVTPNGSVGSVYPAISALRRGADFENYPVGAGKLFVPGVPFPQPFTGAAVIGATAPRLLQADPLQGIIAVSPLGDGRAAYLGGAGTKLTLPAATTPISVSLRQAQPGEAAVDLLRKNYSPFSAVSFEVQATPIMQVGFDFVVVRAAAGTNQQAFTVSLRDERDIADATTQALHSRVRILADNTVAIADHGDVFSPTGVTVAPSVAYRLIVTTDYSFAVWSAVLERRDTGARSVLATRRPLNTDGFQLTPWAVPGSFDLTMTAVASSKNKVFADRLYLDQVRGATIARPLSPAVHAFENLKLGAGGLLTVLDPDFTLAGPGGAPIPGFSGYSGYATGVEGDPVADPIQGIVESSPLGTGRAFYLGGASTNLPLPVGHLVHVGGTNFVLNTDPAPFAVSVFAGKASDLALNAASSDYPHRRVEADFYLQRSEGATNAQTLTFSAVDARDESDPATVVLHSRIRIGADNSVSISDHGDAFTDTGVVLASATAYHLDLAVDYVAATWSAAIRSRDGSANHVLAEARPLNTEEFALSGWVRRGFIEIEHGAVASPSDKALPDRFYLDNLVVFDSPATLDAYKPFFVVAPADASVLPGVSHVFRAEAYGEPAPTYQWFRNDDPISGATAVSLAVPGAPYGVDDDISVAVTNDSGTTVSIADFTVLPPLAAPEITDQPGPLVIAAAKETVTLSATATGNPLPTLQWRRNGKAIRGAQDRSFTFVASTGTVGTYDLVATNSQGVDTGEPILVALPAAPKITTGPRAQTVDEGSPVTFTVAARGVPAHFFFTWKKGAEIVFESTAPSFTIPAVSSADAGKYSVVVSNGVGKPATSAAAALNVRFAPEITVPPVGLEILTGKVATLRVTAVANPAPKYQWRLNGVPIAGEAARRAAYPFTATLVRAGSYDVVVSNALGSAISEPVVVVVNAAPKITLAPVAARKRVGQGYVFNVTATGFPTPDFQWFKGADPIEGATGTTLTFDSLTLADAANYTVRITNAFGTVTSKPVKLDVSLAPYSAVTNATFRLDGYWSDSDGDSGGVDETYTFLKGGRLRFTDFVESEVFSMTLHHFVRSAASPATIAKLRTSVVMYGINVTVNITFTFTSLTSGTYTLTASAPAIGFTANQSGGFTYTEPGL